MCSKSVDDDAEVQIREKKGELKCDFKAVKENFTPAFQLSFSLSPSAERDETHHDLQACDLSILPSLLSEAALRLSCGISNTFTPASLFTDSESELILLVHFIH